MKLPGGSCGCWTTPRAWRTWRQFQETGLSLWAATGRVNIASGSTINGDSASSGAKAWRKASRSSIIISEAIPRWRTRIGYHSPSRDSSRFPGTAATSTNFSASSSIRSFRREHCNPGGRRYPHRGSARQAPRCVSASAPWPARNLSGLTLLSWPLRLLPAERLVGCRQDTGFRCSIV